jgi:ornithine cyclodeaminase/alanine dehydrogenase-like protein (mu-crystallin family)
VSKKAISKDKVTTELGQITAGIKPGRTCEDEIIVCDLTGVVVQDVAGASVVVERALQAGIGESFSL